MNITLIDLQKRKLKNLYIALYVVSKEIPIRKDTCFCNKTVYVMYGVDINGNREVVGVYFDNSNDNRYWLEKFEDIKARELKNILFFITPKNRNIERCIKIVYNDVKIIHTPDDITTQLNSFFPEETIRKMKVKFKDLFLEEDKEKYIDTLEQIRGIVENNKVINLLLEKYQPEIDEFYVYNVQIRRLLYPHYAIRDLKVEINRLKKLEKLCANINEVTEKLLPYINSFEKGRSYSKTDWLKLINDVYEENNEMIGGYINE